MAETETVDILPKNNSYLLGQEKAEQVLLEAWKNNSLHNSWLISGIEELAKQRWPFVLPGFAGCGCAEKEQYTSLEVSENNPVFKLVVNNAHPDLKIIERDYTDTDRRKIMKAIKDGEQLSDEELKGLKSQLLSGWMMCGPLMNFSPSVRQIITGGLWWLTVLMI